VGTEAVLENSQRHLNGILVSGIVTSSMADEKNRSKDIVLWIITVALVALAIFWYKHGR
jgi:hypothetical protein